MEDDAIEIIPGLNAPEEPEVAEVTEPEEKPEPETKPEPEEKPEKYVPLAALHEERMRRKEMAEEMERIKRAHQEILEQLKPKPEPPPDITVDPVTNIDQRLREQEDFRKKQEEYFRLQNERETVETQRQQFFSAYYQAAQQYAEKTPDFKEAYDHVMKGRRQELAASGLDPQTAEMMATQEEQFIVAQAFQQGQNPAERIYNLAKARGWKKTDTSKLETIEKGQQAKTLSGAGTSHKTPDSLEALNEIEDDQEFLKAFKKLAS